MVVDNGSFNSKSVVSTLRLVLSWKVTVHEKTNHIVLGLNLRFEPKQSPRVIIVDFYFLAEIKRGIIPLHNNLLCSF